MTAIDEAGGLWEFNPSQDQGWTLIHPSTSTSTRSTTLTPDMDHYPAARSYHCMTTDGLDTIYLHAGCAAHGRMADLWAFSLSTRTWRRLASAPGPARGGASIAFTGGKLYRMNGFDGEREQGGRVDVYDPEADSWETHVFGPERQGPEPRSVAALLPVCLRGRLFLVTLFGERDPSSLGHQVAGKMLGGVWAFDVEARTWEEVVLEGEGDGDDGIPLARGWFGADRLGERTIVVQGGLAESNERLGDVWRIEFEY